MGRDDVTEVFSRRTNGKQGADKQVERDAGIACFHFGDTRLAGLQACSKFCLRETLLLASLAKVSTQRQFHFDQGTLFWGQTKKISDGTDPKSNGF
jgi:hypothetical protein